MHDIQGLKETTGIRASQRYFSFEISGGPERTEFCVFGERNCLRPLSADAASQLDVLGHADEFSVLLVTTDLTESHSSRPVPRGPLDSTGGRGALTSSLGGQLFTRSLSPSRFTGCLLGTCHCKVQQLSNA